MTAAELRNWSVSSATVATFSGVAIVVLPVDDRRSPCGLAPSTEKPRAGGAQTCRVRETRKAAAAAQGSRARTRSHLTCAGLRCCGTSVDSSCLEPTTGGLGRRSVYADADAWRKPTCRAAFPSPQSTKARPQRDRTFAAFEQCP